jgi:thymidylate kinase
VAGGDAETSAAADITFLLDINPDVSASRKTTDRDKYERDLALLGRVRASYMRQAQAGGRRWMPIVSARPLPRMSGRS